MIGGLGGAPNAPTGFSATAVSTSQIGLGWTETSMNVNRFILERSPDSAFASVTSSLLPASQTTFNDTGLVSATTYFYRLEAINGAGSSGYSMVASATTQTTQTPVSNSAAAPTDLVVYRSGNVTHRSLSLSWTDNATNEASFAIERSTDGVTFNPLALVSADTTTYRNRSVAHGIRYYYRVKSTNAAGSSTYSDVASAVTR